VGKQFKKCIKFIESVSKQFKKVIEMDIDFEESDCEEMPDLN
jgi:hypothetical protein